MSRNLARTSCYFCEGEVITTGPEKSFADTYPECVYRDEYEGLLMAPAECSMCLAKYSAWMNHSGPLWSYRGSADMGTGRTFHDLSFRSTFNDEFDQEDAPVFEVKNGMRVGWWILSEGAEFWVEGFRRRAEWRAKMEERDRKMTVAVVDYASAGDNVVRLGDHIVKSAFDSLWSHGTNTGY